MKYHRKAILGHFSHGEKFRSKKKSGWFDKTILAAGLLLLTFAAVSVVTKNNTFADQAEPTITVGYVGLFTGDSDISIQKGASASTNPADYANKMSSGVLADLELNVDIDLPDGEVFSGDEVLTIPVKSHGVDIEGLGTIQDLNIGYFNSGSIINGNKDVIGVFNYDDGDIRLYFNADIIGLNSLKNLGLLMPDVVTTTATGENRVGYVTIAGEKYSFGISGKNLTNLYDDINVVGASNQSITFETRVGSSLTNSLSSSSGSVGVPADTYVVQVFDGAIGYSNLKIYEAHMIPLALSGSGASSSVAGRIDRTNKFTQVYQNDNEGYASFASRVMSRAGQYGIFSTDTGLKLIINYGALGSDDTDFFSSAESWAEDAADSAIAQGYYETSDRAALIQYYTNCFGENNNIPQSPSTFFDITVNYNSANFDDTEADRFYTAENSIYINDEEDLTSADHTLNMIIGRVTLVEPGNVTLTVVDYSNPNVMKKDLKTLNGGLYKLQRKNASDEYEDYNPEDGGDLKRRVSKNGTIEFKNLESGHYRLVELEVPEGYDSTLSTTNLKDNKYEFVINDLDTEGIRILVGNKKAATPEDDDDDEDTPAAPNTGAGVTGEVSGSADTGIYVMTAIGIALVVVAIKRKVSLD